VIRLLVCCVLASVALWLPRGAAAQDTGPKHLTLAEVLRSVDRHHPSLEEARLLVDAARGDALATEGAFDPKLKVGGKGQPYGKYTKGQLAAVITQVTPWWGASFYAGWRRGFGSFAIYDGDLETLSGGELSTGFELPLWQGGPIDEMRARLQQADFDVLSSKQRKELVSLLVKNAAARAYWNWAEAGQRLRISQDLLRVATQRVAGLERRIEKGDAPDILGVDSQRIVLDRRAKVVAARQKLEQAAVKLSLFLRDPEGKPRRVSDARLPRGVASTSVPTKARLQRDIRRGRMSRPDVKMLALAEQRQQVEVDFRDNQLAPRVNLQGWLAKDFGSGKDELRPLEVGVGLSVEIPLLFRKERGKRQAARAKLAAVRQKTRLGRDKVEAEIRIAFAAVKAAAETVNLAKKKRVVAERLAAAERRKLELGETDLFTVNLRELSAASASADEMKARADLQRALADYQTAAARAPR
jgi:outer membrane protein TolC